MTFCDLDYRSFSKIEQKRAPVSKASASELFALFQEEIWKSVMIIDCRPYKDFAREHICGAFCVAVVKDARGRVSAPFKKAALSSFYKCYEGWA